MLLKIYIVIHLFYVEEQNTKTFPTTSKPSGAAPTWESHLYLRLFPRGLKGDQKGPQLENPSTGIQRFMGAVII